MPTKEEWESHREAIYRIYMVEGKPLKELILEMKEKYGFSATKNQYFYKFKQWHMPKYLSPEKWKAIGKLERQRQESGCSAATVVLGGHRLHREKVQRQIARYSFVSTCDFMYPGQRPLMPPDVVLRTPSPQPVPALSFGTKSLPWFEFRGSMLKGFLITLSNNSELGRVSGDWAVELSKLVEKLHLDSEPLQNISSREVTLRITDSRTGEVSTLWERVTPAEFLFRTEQLLYRIANNDATDEDLDDILYVLKHQWLAKPLIEALVASDHFAAQAMVEYLMAASLHADDVELFKWLYDPRRNRLCPGLKHIHSCRHYFHGMSPFEGAFAHCSISIASFLVESGYQLTIKPCGRAGLPVLKCPYRLPGDVQHSDRELSQLLTLRFAVVPSCPREELLEWAKEALRWGYGECLAIIIGELSKDGWDHGVHNNIEVLVHAIVIGDEDLSSRIMKSISDEHAHAEDRKDPWCQGKLHWAFCNLMQRGKAEACQKILDWGYRLNDLYYADHPTWTGFSNQERLRSYPGALQLAAYHADLDSVCFLLERGADPNLHAPFPGVLKDKRGWGPQCFGHTALQAALLGNSVDTAVYLVQHGARLVGGELCIAIRSGLQPAIDMLLRYGAPVDDLNYYNLYEEEDPIAYGASPLMEAIMAKNGPTIEYLLSTRELQDGSCYDPAALCAAVDQNLIYIVDLMVSRRQEFKKFIESGFSAKSQSIISRWEGTALITAARQELPLFEDLLQDLSAMPLEAYSLMHFTAEYATTPMTDMSRMNFQFQITHHLDLISAAIRDRVTTPYIQRFIRRGAFVTIVSLKEAVPRSDMALLRLLLSHLSESEVSCKLDSTADSTGNLARTDENHSVNLSKVLSIAATMPDMTALNILLSHEHFLGTLEGSCGADHLASAGQLGHIENMASLLEKGANINACTTYMGFLDTVLETTAFFGRLDATKFVLDKNLTIEGEARRHYVNAVRMAQEQCHYAVANLIKSHGGWTRWDQDMLELFERTWSQMNVDGLYRRRFCCLEVDISEVAELGTTSHSASDGVLGQCHETEEPPTVVSNAADRDFDRWLSSLTSPQGVRAMETSLDSIAVVPTTPADVPGTPEEIRLGANEGLLDGEAGTIAECFFPDSFTMGEDSGDGSSVAGGSHGIWPAVVHEDEPILMASGGGISSTELDSCFVANEDIGDTLDLGLGLEWLGNEIDGTGSGLE